MAYFSVDRLYKPAASGVRYIAAFVCILSAVCGTISGHGYIALFGIGSASLAYFSTNATRDPVRLLLLTHPLITYFCSTLLFALINGNLALTGFENPSLAFGIALVYQVAIVIGHAAANALHSRSIEKDREVVSTSSSNSLLLAGAFFLLIALATLTGFLQGLSPVWTSCFCLAIAFYVDRPNVRTWRVALASTGLMFLIAALINERTPLFAITLYWLVAFMALSPRIFTVRNIAILLVSIFAINWATYAFVTARIEESRGTTNNVVARTTELLLSYDSFAYAIPFLQQGTQTSLDYSARGRYYSDFLRSSVGNTADLSPVARMALLAHMDIVVSKMPFVSEVSWPEIGNLLSASTPFGGSNADLIFSDRVVWGLGLRDRTSVGRPLITIPGELYLMGGLLGLLALTTILYAILFVEISLMRSALGFGLPYLLISTSLFYGITMTGTALALTATAVRTLPLILIVVTTFRSLGWSRKVVTQNALAAGQS